MGWKLPTLTAGLWVIALTVVSVMLGLVIAGPEGTLLGAIPLALGTVLAGYVPVIRDRLQQRKSAQELWQGSVEQPLPQSWARLLDPRREVVGFAGRDAELAALMAWCEDDRASRLRLATGPGGVGKTRLAVELADRMGATGWQCERIADGKEAGTISALRAATSGRALLVVDYAEARTGLGQMLNDLAGDQGAGLRVLLLARSAGDWWDQLGVGDPRVWDMTQAAKSAELALSSAIAEQLSDAEVIELAVHDFARELALPERAVEIARSDTSHRRVLDLHAAALVALLDEAGTGPVHVDIGTVLSELLRHEMHFWYDSARASGLDAGPGGLPPSTLRRVVAAGALLGAATEEEARLLPGRVPGLSPSARVARWLRDLYPPGPGDLNWLGSLQPDRLAELHVTRELAASPELAIACMRHLDPRQARQAVTLLARASIDDPHAEILLSQALPGAAGFIADLDAPIETLIAIFNAIPYPSVILAPAAALLAQRVLTLLPAESGPATRAYWLRFLGFWYSELGRQDQALAVAEERVGIYQGLAAADPRDYRSDLADSLALLGVRLSAVGRSTEALPVLEEALDIRQELAAADPDQYRPDLAVSLSNYAGRLWEVGRLAEALPVIEEAVDIRRELAAANPDRYRPDFAGDLINMGLALSALNRRDEALAVIEEAVEIYRELAAANPDRYSPGLASSLASLGIRYSNLDRLDEALTVEQEALTIRRELAATNPDGYRAGLASSLSNIGVTLAAAGRTDEALTVEQEALAILRELAVANPDGYRADLATSLLNLALWLWQLDRLDEGLPIIEEGVDIYRVMAAADPDRYSPGLARSLTQLADAYDELNQASEADAARSEAARITDAGP